LVSCHQSHYLAAAQIKNPSRSINTVTWAQGNISGPGALK
jgi:hypothetical protein